MSFSSNIFLFAFLPLSLIGYYLIRKDLRNVFLLFVSAGFFLWADPKALILLAAVIMISYLFALAIQGASGQKTLKKLILIAAVLTDVGILVYFKYWNFIIDNLNRLLQKGLPSPAVVLPVGISFFIFQSISYLADVYTGKTEPDRNIIRVALYFALFTKLTQGPIMRYGDMKEDLRSRGVDLEMMASGVERFIIGMTKKLLIADQLGSVSDAIFALPKEGLGTSLAWGGVLAYTLQLYFDFSGYSDMAVGLGRMFGFHLTENFNYPYFSRSVTEFWRRWHISLSTWFRDYIYIPLGGNRRGNQYVNLFVVFLVTGLWHGAAWTFILWGIFHGIILIIEKLLTKAGIRKKIPSFINWIVTMFLVMIGWVFFRASGVSDAFGYLLTMFGLRHGAEVQYSLKWFYTSKIAVITLIGLAAMLPWKEICPKTAKTLEGTYLALGLKFIIMVGLLALCVMLAMTSTYSSFIYFQF